MSTAILTEFAPLTNLLRTVPHKAQKGFSWWDIEWTCLDASREFVAVGTDIGIVYLYDRHAGSLQRLHLKVADGREFVSRLCRDVHVCVHGLHFTTKIISVGKNQKNLFFQKNYFLEK